MEGYIGLTRKELERMANDIIFKSGIDEKMAEYPVITYKKIQDIKYREISMDPDDVKSLLEGLPFDWSSFKRWSDWK